MYVCVCNAVSDKAIKQAVQQGYDSFEAIQRELAVGTCCGRCKPCAQDLIRQCLEQKPEPLSAFFTPAFA
ncbi:MAG: (2Fe-2S)-binding protein [Thiothrix sp.]|nr:MAG: (2Fe-2S)-binding protein [Thiothrix sp.]